MVKRTPPLESFAPELKLCWQRASLSPVIIPVSSKSKATSLRHRLYKLRVALKEANDPIYTSAQYASIRIEPADLRFPDARWIVRVEPADAEFKDAFKAIGLSNEEIPDIDLDLDLLAETPDDNPT